jgi:hypothetical protein
MATPTKEQKNGRKIFPKNSAPSEFRGYPGNYTNSYNYPKFSTDSAVCSKVQVMP